MPNSFFLFSISETWPTKALKRLLDNTAHFKGFANMSSLTLFARFREIARMSSERHFSRLLRLF
jgi:hypothetical protein